MSRPEKVDLVQRRWVPLPGTRWEVLLRGRWRKATGERVSVERTGAQGQPGGWDLRPVFGLVYVRPRCARRVLDGG